MSVRIVLYIILAAVCLYVSYLVINLIVSSDLPLWLKIMLLK